MRLILVDRDSARFDWMAGCIRHRLIISFEKVCTSLGICKFRLGWIGNVDSAEQRQKS